MENSFIQNTTQEPLFTPQYLNVEYFFGKTVEFSRPVIDFFKDPQTWHIFGLIVGFFAIFFIAIIIYSILRMIEIRKAEKEEIDEKIKEALSKEKEKERNENPRWKYILTLVESPNESDWRVAIIEADAMMEEVLRNSGLSGGTVSELLEAAKGSGYQSIQDAWDGHLVRNQIAHEGSDFPVSQVESRRVVKMFQNFFEELQVI